LGSKEKLQCCGGLKVDKLRTKAKSDDWRKDTSTVTRWFKDIDQVGYLNY